MKILVVEDERHITRLLQVNLQRAEYDVVTASCAGEAMRIAERDQPDLAIIDQNLPDIAGHLLAGMLHKQQPAAALLMMFERGTVQADWVQDWIKPANVYITKPFAPMEIIALVRRL